MSSETKTGDSIDPANPEDTTSNPDKPGIELKLTSEGLLRGEFNDTFSARCVIRETEMTLPPTIILGRIGPSDYSPTSIFIHQDLARALIPLLQRFVETGALGDQQSPTPEAETSLTQELLHLEEADNIS
jgi:hypothetical protein